MQYIRLTSYQDNGGLTKIRAHGWLTSSHIKTILKFYACRRYIQSAPCPFRLSLNTKGWKSRPIRTRCERFFLRKLSYPPMRYQRIQDNNWSHRVIFSYWTHHQPGDISEEGSRTRIWSNYYVEEEVVQLGLNRGVRSAIANQPVAWSGTEVQHDW
jgi:hypothetical protein